MTRSPEPTRLQLRSPEVDSSNGRPRQADGGADGSAREGAPARCLVLGLGNPGERYTETRHNVGFRVVEELARRRAVTFADAGGSQRPALECNSRVAECGDLILAAPQTYMNRSGHAARCLSERRGLAAESFLVVYDEIHLPLGTLRLRRQGSPAGHRGMESVLESLGTDRVPRLRLGVGTGEGPSPGDDLVVFVLEPFAAGERERAAAMIARAADACEVWAQDGAEAAMQRFNGPPSDLAEQSGER